VAAAKGVHLEGRVDGVQAEVAVSTPEVLRALRNVLENAIRHTPPDGSVMVEAGSRSTEAYVSVIDTGGGIPEADLERIFDVGYQADSARSAGSSGLGLAIARGFVEAHQGDISAANENGGARVTVRLPRAPVA
jgi:signal transduction histidine kinase